ncbi:hypothetical protein D3C86_1346210 [compost metagenome]
MPGDGLFGQRHLELLGRQRAALEQDAPQAGLLQLEAQGLADLLGAHEAQLDQDLGELPLGLGGEHREGPLVSRVVDESAPQEDGARTLLGALLGEGPVHDLGAASPRLDQELAEHAPGAGLGLEGRLQLRH